MRLTDDQIHVLEVIEALGSATTAGQLRAVANKRALPGLRTAVAALCGYGYLRQYAVGHYAKTLDGRDGLRSHVMQLAG